jgi:hypothetical protein
MNTSNATAKDSSEALVRYGIGLPHINHIAKFAKERTLLYRKWKADIASVPDSQIWKDLILTFENENSLRNNVMHGVSKVVQGGRAFQTGQILQFGRVKPDQTIEFDERLGEPYRVAYFSVMNMCANYYTRNFNKPYSQLLKDRNGQMYVLNLIIKNTSEKMIEHGIKNTV